MKRAAILLGFFLFFTSPVRAAQKNILIINQVRGSECCDVGGVQVLTYQLDLSRRLQLPMAFALRYDALHEAEITNHFPRSSVEVGAFLEVTPNLARDAHVVYKGPRDRWYKSQNAYLLGYEPRDRRKLIDTYMGAFFSLFGVYPRVTVAWMIDAPSLLYLQEKYGVVFHELTREQWGTDSYTLYGGPIGQPYIPSRNWPLLPAGSARTGLPLVIGRQTVIDPVYSYGDEASVYTSQPNDYLKAGLSTTYFQKLVRQALSQQPEGFVLLGLETSMPDIDQKEYGRQLHFIANLRDASEVSVVLPSDYARKRLASQSSNRVAIFAGESDSAQAVWVSAPTYRVRIIADKKTHAVFIDDLRMYSDALIDPYSTNTPVTPNAYWIVPFTIDGSRYFQKRLQSFVDRFVSWEKRIARRADPCVASLSVFSDTCSVPEGIRLPQTQSQEPLFVIRDGEIRYVSAQGDVTLSFFPDRFRIGTRDVSFPTTDATLRTLNTNSLFGMRYIWDEGGVTCVPWVDKAASLQKITTVFPQVYVPETAGEDVSLTHSLLIPAAHTVELGRNPIRIVLYARDKGGHTATTSAVPVLSLREDPTARTDTHVPETSLGEYYMDIMPTKAGDVTPVVRLGNEVVTLPSIRVVPNCLHTIVCVLHPRMLVSWIMMNVRERFHVR